MSDQVRLPLGARAREYALAAMAARDDAETTWVQDDKGRAIAAIVPCDVALRGDWRKAQAGIDSEICGPPVGDPILPATVDEPLAPREVSGTSYEAQRERGWAFPWHLEGGDTDTREFIAAMLAGGTVSDRELLREIGAAELERHRPSHLHDRGRCTTGECDGTGVLPEPGDPMGAEADRG
jgi:hypothetical protein